ncbi:MAG: hypothetical protein A2W33_04180 [Chloroflexi bacterium RBG_16_52_11]|nr:MAG: hypothetical protein A2W33_04180 [Chloroflexi bacterium RBG_16_52_11]
MMTLNFAFWTLVVLFAIVGAMRGWAKELLVTFSAILALFFIEIFVRYIPPVRSFFAPPNDATEFWVQTTILIIMVLFGYQTPNLAKFASPKFARERLSDALLGFFLGAFNGYLIFGSIWYFMAESGYPFPSYITAPTNDPWILAYLPPVWLGIPTIYFAVAVAFLFVLIVFI